MTTNARRPVFTKEATLTRSDTTAKKLFTLPRYARIVEIIVINAATATGATISLGTAASSTYFVNAQSVATVGANRPATTGAEYGTLSAMTDIYGLIGGSAVAGGGFRVIFVCTSDKLKGNT